MTRCRVDKPVDLWQREAILGAGFIKVGEVYADSPLAGGFLHHDNI